MWILKRLVCLMYGHIFIDVGWENSHYRYCLQCSKVMPPAMMEVNLSEGSGYCGKMEA